ncbi:MAG: hypothetical protein E3J72_15280 [Planctomycetota bacterium]|nr:MAG: hypothetical protein E3J72_15280 [Planctomycetota bacterium]
MPTSDTRAWRKKAAKKKNTHKCNLHGQSFHREIRIIGDNCQELSEAECEKIVRFIPIEEIQEPNERGAKVSDYYWHQSNITHTSKKELFEVDDDARHYIVRKGLSSIEAVFDRIRIEFKCISKIRIFIHHDYDEDNKTAKDVLIIEIYSDMSGKEFYQAKKKIYTDLISEEDGILCNHFSIQPG